VTDVLDAEVVSEETTFEPDLPLRLFGHCNDALDLPLDPRELNRLHDSCPAILDPQPWPDPARKGSTYMLKGARCSCVCHTRPGTVSPGATTKGN
jgi:hypothetical protein